MVFTKEYWQKRRKEKEEKAKRAKRQEDFEKHLEKVHVDGVEIKMEIPQIIKKKEEPKPKQEEVAQVQTKGDPTLSLKMSLAELQVDHLAHSFLINSVYQSYAQLGLPQHLAQAEIERLVAPHRQRVADIEAVLGQFNE